MYYTFYDPMTPDTSFLLPYSFPHKLKWFAQRFCSNCYCISTAEPFCVFSALTVSTQQNRLWDKLSLSTVNYFKKLKLIAQEGRVYAI